MAAPDPQQRIPPRPAQTAGTAPPADSAQRAGDAGRRRHRSTWRYLIGVLGPGLVTGAADDDPSGIATYSQTGAQFGYGHYGPPCGCCRW